MPLATCPRCGKMFNKTTSQVCLKCQDAEEEDYEAVRAFLSCNPDVSPDEVVEGTGVDHACVIRLLEEGRIAQVDANRAKTIRCGRCGRPAISLSKRLCQKCLAELNTEFARLSSEIKLPPKKNVNIGESVRSVLERKRRENE